MVISNIFEQFPTARLPEHAHDFRQNLRKLSLFITSLRFIDFSATNSLLSFNVYVILAPGYVSNQIESNRGNRRL